ncbi:hypothetical protein [Methanofollis fontis]|uniref:HEAT repeat domain-containing protein n=1 Tax=Methanofollis fontis TaxID=2052832 RepID=A0A483CTE2_9EURY|nr:hypothetical protein [Methanofollis fontis]TAJ43954.1 hypothetical protein CUJ86_07830 [Methanofollis fontis]
MNHSGDADLEAALESGNEDAVCAALQDMLIFRSAHPLSPADLDAVAGVLEGGGRAGRLALQVLYVAAVRQGMLPADTERAAEGIRRILGECGDDRTVVTHAVRLLGAMDHPLAIERLRSGRERVKTEDYCHPMMVDYLRRHDADLAALQGAPGKNLREIRAYARDPAAHEERVQMEQEDEVEIL